MTWLRRTAAILIALAMLAEPAARAGTYFYFRGGAATQATASAPAAPNTTGTFAILVDGPAVGTRGMPYSATTYAYYNAGTVNYSVLSDALPAGISLNPATGTISGTPSVDGQAHAVIQAVDAANGNVAAADFYLAVYDPFGLSGNPSTTVQAGGVYSTTLFAFGGAQPYQFSTSGLPPGIAASPSATSISLSGTPTSGGVFPIAVTATDANGTTASYSYTLSVIAQLAITSLPPSTASVGSPYSGSVTASGGTAPYSYALAAGSLPAGLSLKPATGIIAGTPTLVQSKTGIKIKVTDAVGATFTTAPFSIIVAGAIPLAIAGTPPTTIQEGSAYAAQFSASGGASPYTFSLATGALPAGLNLNPSSGLISGVPALGSHGSYPLAVRVADNAGHAASASPFTLIVTEPPLTLAGGHTETIERNVAYSTSFVAAGGSGQGYVYSLGAGALPPGLAIDPSTGILAGTPTAYGNYPGLKAQVTDSLGNTANSAVFALLVVSPSPLQVIGNPAATVQQGQAYSAEFDAFDGSGTGYSFAFAGAALPPGLALTSNGNPAAILITGTPTQSGNYPGLQIAVTDSLGNTALSSAFTIDVAPPPPPADPLAVIGNPPQASLGIAYTTQLAASGGAPPYTYALSGSLPAGLAFDPSTGSISGTPTTVQTAANLQVTVTDSHAATAASQPFSIAVVDGNPITIAWTPQTIWSVGDTFAAVPSVAGGNSSAYVFATTGTLPPVVTQSPADGSLNGTLTTVGSFGPVTLTVSDGLRSASTAPVTFTVMNPPLTVASSISSVGSEGYPYESDFFATGGKDASWLAVVGEIDVITVN